MVSPSFNRPACRRQRLRNRLRARLRLARYRDSVRRLFRIRANPDQRGLGLASFARGLPACVTEWCHGTPLSPLGMARADCTLLHFILLLGHLPALTQAHLPIERSSSLRKASRRPSGPHPPDVQPRTQNATAPRHPSPSTKLWRCRWRRHRLLFARQRSRRCRAPPSC